MEARSHEVIEAPCQVVNLASGRTITARPITVGQLPRFVKAIRPAFGALVALVPAASSPGGQAGQGAEPFIGNVGDAAAEAAESVDAVELLGLIADHGDAINEAVAIVTGEPREVIEALNLEEAAEVLRAVWAVNQDFFTQRVLPLLARG